MNKEITHLNVLIVEDENRNIEILQRILLNEGVRNIRTAQNTEKALELLEREFPDLILLDLKIPYQDGGIEDSINSIQIILEVESRNRIFEHHIRIIIISGTTQERGLQKLIARDKSLIQHMFDKGLMGKNSDEFRNELMQQIKNTLKHPVKREKPSISILDSYRNTLSHLKDKDKLLYDYLMTYVFKRYSLINEESENEIAQAIIIRCGMVVEDLIERFNFDLSPLKGRKFSLGELKELMAVPAEDDKNVGMKLMALSGRRWNDVNKSLDVIDNGKISRQACEYAHLAYKHRNHASHKGKMDTKNENIFKDNNFTKEHTAISISLIIPLIQDYIKYLKHQEKN